MIAIFYLVLQILILYSYVVIANVLISWLVAFNILNTSNRFVYMILDFTYRLTEPFLRKIRQFLPNLVAFDGVLCDLVRTVASKSANVFCVIPPTGDPHFIV